MAPKYTIISQVDIDYSRGLPGFELIGFAYFRSDLEEESRERRERNQDVKAELCMGALRPDYGLRESILSNNILTTAFCFHTVFKAFFYEIRKSDREE
jgi:hypothetical protein